MKQQLKFRLMTPSNRVLHFGYLTLVLIHGSIFAIGFIAGVLYIKK